MKKIILPLFTAVSIAVSSKAQSLSGLEASLIRSDYTGKSDGSTVDTKAKAGFRVGFVTDNYLGPNLSLQDGLLYVMNGFQFLDAKVTVSTLEIPINVLYKFGKPGTDRFFIGAGIYVAYNLGGIIKAPDMFGNTTSSSLKIGSQANDDMKGFDFGLGANIGYQFHDGFFLRLYYQAGLVNLQPQGDANNTEKNENYGLSIGYLFPERHSNSHKKEVKKIVN